MYSAERARRFELFAAAFEPLLRACNPNVSRLELYSATVRRFDELDPRAVDCVGFLAGRRAAVLGPEMKLEEAEATLRAQLREVMSDPRQLRAQSECSTHHFSSAWPAGRPPSRRVVAWEIFAGELTDVHDALEAWEKLPDEKQRKYFRFEKLWNDNVVIGDGANAKNGNEENDKHKANDDDDDEEYNDDEDEANDNEYKDEDGDGDGDGDSGGNDDDDDDDDDEFYKRKKPAAPANPKASKMAKTNTSTRTKKG